MYMIPTLSEGESIPVQPAPEDAATEAQQQLNLTEPKASLSEAKAPTSSSWRQKLWTAGKWGAGLLGGMYLAKQAVTGVQAYREVSKRAKASMERNPTRYDPYTRTIVPGQDPRGFYSAFEDPLLK